MGLHYCDRYDTTRVVVLRRRECGASQPRDQSVAQSLLIDGEAGCTGTGLLSIIGLEARLDFPTLEAGRPARRDLLARPDCRRFAFPLTQKSGAR